MNKVRFYNIDLNVHNYESALEICNQYYNSDKCNSLFYLNAHCFNIAQKNEKYLNSLNQANMLLNDGLGISIGALFKGIRLKANMNGSDFTPALLEHAAKHNKKIYLLGSKPGVVNKTKKVLEKDIKGIQIVGMHHGFFDNDSEIIEDINNSGAELLIVGMGVPMQELWIMENINKFEHVKIASAAGAVMDFISKNIIRAPKWVQKIYMEWFFRFLMEPKRMFKRYFIGNIIFLTYIFKLRKLKV